jgi:hypothetical protein
MKEIAFSIIFVVALLGSPHIAGAIAAPSLVLSSVRISPAEVMLGGSFESEMVVVNVGSLVALTAALSLDLASIPGTPFSIVGSGTLLNIGELGVGENRTLHATFAVSYEKGAGAYAIPYRLTYSDENKYSYTNAGTFAVVASGTPDVEIHSVTVDPEKLNPNLDGTFSVSFINMGTEVAKDVNIRIYNDGGLLTSTITYIGELDRGAVKTVAFGIYVDEDAAIGTRLLNITLAYEDPSGNPYASWKVYELRVYRLQPLIPVYYYPFMVGGAAFMIGIYIASRKLGYRLW